MLLAVGGVAASVLGMRAAARVAIGRQDQPVYLRALAAAAVLAVGIIATVTVLKPDFTVVPGPC